MNLPCRLFIISSSTLVLMLFCTPVKSCGPDMYIDDGRFALFREELAGIPALEPYYYTRAFSSGYSGAGAESDYRKNCLEWARFTNWKANEDDIYELQYNTTPDVFLGAHIDENWDIFRENSFVKWLTRKDNKAALDYFVLAKRSEAAQTIQRDPWGEGDDSRQPLLESVIDEAITKTATVKDQFLKQRYAFQAVKSLHYMGNKAQSSPKLIAIYDKHLADENTIVARWGLLYYAFAQTDPRKRTEFLVRAFDETDEKKGYVYQWVSLPELDSLEAVTRDKKLLVQIHALRAVKNPGRALNSIKTIYNVDPESKYLPLLITREINKLEDWLWSPEQLGFESPVRQNLFQKERGEHDNYDTSYTYFAVINHKKDRVYLAEVRQFLEGKLRVASEENKHFMRLAVIHLYHIEGNFAAAKELLDKGSFFIEPALERQRIIEKILSVMHLEDVTKAVVKDDLEVHFAMLEEVGVKWQRTKNYWGDDDPRSIELRDDVGELMMVLSKQYQQKGDHVTAGLLYQKAGLMVNEYDGWEYSGDSLVNYAKIAWFDRYASPAIIDALLAFKAKKNKTPFEQFISSEKWAPNDWYLDLKATLLIREKKYHEALAVMEKMDERFWADNYEFKNHLPKKTILSAGTLLPESAVKETIYPYPSKKLILRDIVNTLDAASKTRSKSEQAKLYFMLGNAMYNITHHGKAWMMFSYGNSSQELDGWVNEGYQWAFFTFSPNNERYKRAYYQTSEAMRMYELSYRLSKESNKAFAIQPLTMLLYCDRIAERFRLADSKHKDGIDRNIAWGEHPFRSTYLEQLKTEYKGMDRLELYESHCPDLMSEQVQPF